MIETEIWDLFFEIFECHWPYSGKRLPDWSFFDNFFEKNFLLKMTQKGKEIYLKWQLRKYVQGGIENEQVRQTIYLM